MAALVNNKSLSHRTKAQAATFPRRSSLRRQVLECNLHRQTQVASRSLSRELRMSTENLVASDDDNSENENERLTKTKKVCGFRLAFPAFLSGPRNNSRATNRSDAAQRAQRAQQPSNKENGALATTMLNGVLATSSLRTKKDSYSECDELDLANLGLSDSDFGPPPLKRGKIDIQTEFRPKPPAAPLPRRKDYTARKFTKLDTSTSSDDISF